MSIPVPFEDYWPVQYELECECDGEFVEQGYPHKKITSKLDKIAKLLEEQRASGQEVEYNLTLYASGTSHALMDYNPSSSTTANRSYTSSQRNVVSLNFLTGEYTGVPINSTIVLPYKKLIAMQIANDASATDIRFTVNKPKYEAARGKILASTSYSHPLFIFPTIWGLNLTVDDNATADASVRVFGVY
jgi:hypothetical protein